MAAASGNPLFAEMLESLNDTVQRAMTLALGLTRAGSKERARRVYDEHEAVADAISRGDAEAAGLTMRYHPTAPDSASRTGSATVERLPNLSDRLAGRPHPPGAPWVLT